MFNPSEGIFSRLWQFATDINLLLNRLDALEAENAELRQYKEKYDQLLTDSLRHGEVMSGNIMKLLLDGKLTGGAQ